MSSTLTAIHIEKIKQRITVLEDMINNYKAMYDACLRELKELKDQVNEIK